MPETAPSISPLGKTPGLISNPAQGPAPSQASGNERAPAPNRAPSQAPSAAKNPVLAVKNLSCAIDGVEILHDISISVDKGDFVSILGPNGAGKSTFLKCLLRLHDRAVLTGSIEVDGMSISRYGQKSLARVISYVPQAGGWIPPFSVIDFARLSRFPYASAVSGLTEADDLAVSKALELTGLESLSRRLLKTLSGGERQKAYLAAALAQETPIMLLDEPAASLDPRHAAELASLLRRLNTEKGLTMLMVTHDLNHPLRAGGLALVLKSGRRRYFGPVEGLEGEVLERAFEHGFLYLDHPSGGGRVIISQ